MYTIGEWDVRVCQVRDLVSKQASLFLSLSFASRLRSSSIPAAQIIKYGGKLVDEFSLSTRLSVTHVIGVPVSKYRCPPLEVERITKLLLPELKDVPGLPSHIELRRRPEFAKCEVLHSEWVTHSIAVSGLDWTPEVRHPG